MAHCSVPALTDLMSGQVQVMFDNLPSSIEHIRVGGIRALAVTPATRSQACRMSRPSASQCRATPLRDRKRLGGYQEIEGVPLGGSSLRAIGSKFAGGGREPCCAFQGASPQISAFQDNATASLIRYSGPGWRVSGEIFANQGLAPLQMR